MVSLPVRECGLKYHPCLLCAGSGASLPVRECGLKYKAFELSREQLPRHSLCGSVD